jgi:E3 ubiquitin-protein ligase SHPRH
LVVTPPILLKQWADEVQKHAPGLKVLIYEGNTASLVRNMQKAAANSGPAAEISNKGTRQGSEKAANSKQEDSKAKRPANWKTYAAEFDVVLTTYQTLTKELNVARAPVKRPRREIATYQAEDERYRSPLIAVEYVDHRSPFVSRN